MKRKLLICLTVCLMLIASLFLVACDKCNKHTHAYDDVLTAGDTQHWYECSCGAKKDVADHDYVLELANETTLKQAATATTKAQYYKSCVCGAKSATEYFETDKAPANLQVADISKTYDGTPVAEPTVTFDGVGAENFAYYKGNEKLTERPTDAGTYKVVVTVDETDTHAGDRVEKEFTIAKKTLNYLEVTKVYNGKRGFGEKAGIYCQLGVEHGVIAGDTVFLETSDDFEYNVGKYYFVRMNSTDDRDTVWLLGDDAANYDFQGNDVVGEVTVTPKTLNYLEITKVYDGEGVLAYELGTEHGVVAGDEVLFYCDEAPDYIVGTYGLIPENDPTSIDDPGADDRALLAGADKANYKFAERIEGKYKLCATITVTPKVLTSISFRNATYNGSTNFAFVLTASHGLVSGETFLLQVTTVSKNVGNAVEIASISYNNSNYSIDKSAITLDIVPKTINVTAEFEYSGTEVRQIHAPSPSLSDVIGGDEVYIEITFDKAGVDATVLTGDDAPYLDGADAGNYVLGTYSFSIVPKKLTLKAGEEISESKIYSGNKAHTIFVSSNRFDGYVDTDAASLWLTATLPSRNVGTYTDVVLTPYLGNSAFGTVSHNYDFSSVTATITVNKMTVSVYGVEAEYNGTTTFTYTEPLSLVKYTSGQDSILRVDEVYLNSFTLENPDVTEEEFLYDGDYTLSGKDAGNYDIDEFIVSIVPKKLTNLDLKITPATYNTQVITLLEKDGVVAGETVKISITDINDQDFWVGFSIFMQLADGTAPDEYRYETIALVTSGDYANYQLATYDDGYGNQVVGTVEGVAYCDVQYDGSCACGTSHLTETLTFTGGEAVGKSATIACDSYYEGGIYKIALEGGEYEFLGSDQFFNISGIYDANGNKLADSIGTYILPKGTYYFHVYVGTSPHMDTIWVKKTAEYCSFETARVFECQTDETDSFTLSAGDKLYLKIMGGENSQLNDFYISVPTGSAATFTLALYSLDDTTEPYYVEETAINSYYWDICDTSDFYVVLTCVTAGDIDMSAAN